MDKVKALIDTNVLLDHLARREGFETPLFSLPTYFLSVLNVKTVLWCLAQLLALQIKDA